MLSKSIDKIVLHKDSCHGGLVLDIHTHYSLKTPSVFTLDYDVERATRVTFEGDVSYLNQYDFRNGILMTNAMGVDYLFMHFLPCKDVYVATSIRVRSVKDREYIQNFKVTNIAQYMEFDKYKYTSKHDNGVITMKREVIIPDRVEEVEHCLFSELHTIGHLVDTIGITTNYLFEHLSWPEVKTFGMIYKVINKYVQRKLDAYPIELRKRCLHDLFTYVTDAEYSFDFSPEGLAYYVDRSQSEAVIPMKNEPRDEVAVKLDEIVEIPTLDIECGTSMDMDDTYMFKYVEAVNANNQKGVVDVKFLYDASARNDFLSNFFIDNRNNFLIEASGKYSTKLFEVFFEKEDAIGNYEIGKRGFYKIDPHALVVESSFSSSTYNSVRSSVVVFRIGYALFDSKGREFKHVLVTPHLATDSEIIGSRKDRKMRFFPDVSLDEFGEDFFIHPEDYSKAAYVSLIILFDDNNSANEYSLNITNLRTLTDSSFKVGLHSLCVLSKDERYLVGDRWVSWTGSPIVTDMTLDTFLDKNGIDSVFKYRDYIRRVTSMVHTHLVLGWSAVRKFHCNLIIDFDILKRMRVRGGAYFDRVKCGYVRSDKGPLYLQLSET
jgi:hypothetical protein